MGIDPVLDGKQNLLTAEKFYKGESFDDPFHRAPLYPYLLSILQKANVFELSVPSLARWLNSLAVVITTWLACNLAWLIWKRNYAVWITGLLVGLNPVILFFAGDPLDITLATTCLTAVAWMLYRGYKSRKFRWGYWLFGGVILGVGIALRSHLMLVGLLWPVLACLATIHNRNTRKPKYILVAFTLGMVGPILSFVGVGLANKAVSGEFRMTPWGGAYLLWAGNGPMNNGRYYAQTVRVEYNATYENPTIYESIYHYQKLTGKEPPFEVGEMNSFFIERTFQQISQAPKAWMDLMFRKLYSLVNNYEQYDNKTYSLQKSLSPLLAKNPICWGLVIVLATFGGLTLSFSRRTTFFGILALAVLYGIMVLSTYTANRYRVPLIPLLAVLAAGVPKFFMRRDQYSGNLFFILMFSTALVGIVTFVPFFGIADKDTYIADYGLMANAAHRQGRDQDAVFWANKVLRIDSSRDDVKEVFFISRFNQWFTQSQSPPTVSTARTHLEQLEELNRNSSGLAFARGVYLWKLGDESNACFLWKFAASEYGHSGSVDALIWNCSIDEEFLNELPTQSWRKTWAVKNADLGFQAGPEDLPVTEESVLAASEMYRIAYSPFLPE
jgi:hypothetical protein